MDDGRDDGREAQSTDDASERGDQHLTFDSVWEVLQLTQIVGRCVEGVSNHSSCQVRDGVSLEQPLGEGVEGSEMVESVVVLHDEMILGVSHTSHMRVVP